MTTPIKFRISAPEPGEHFFHGETTIHGVGEQAHIDVAMPVWTPGSYLVREYAQHVHRFRASGNDQDTRHVRKQDKTTWRVDCRDTASIMLSYDVYAHDLGVRNNHLDATHGFVTPTATFVHPIGRLGDAIELEVAAPEGWDVFCPLDEVVPGRGFFGAADFDELCDSPIEMGAKLERFEFEACGRLHTMVFWGRGNWSRARLERDLPEIIEANASIFGGDVPYEDYLCITLLTDNLYGGLEHRKSTALMYPRHEFDKGEGALDVPVTDEGYLNYLTLFAHEHFHVWHVKRIRPEVLGPFEYGSENYTRDIWTIEGITSYYQELALLRASIVEPVTFLKTLARRIHRLENLPGRRVRSLEEAGFDAWIRLYRPHESNSNVDINYYLKGQLVTMLLDVLIRVETRGERSFDDVLRHLWQHYSGDTGYPEGGLETAGGIIKALPLLGDDPFWVINGDIWTDWDYSDLPTRLDEEQLGHLVMVDNPVHHQDGDFVIEHGVLVNEIREGQQTKTFSGVGLYRKGLLAPYPEGKQPLKPFFDRAIDKKQLAASHLGGFWTDVGTPERLHQLNQRLEK